MKVNKPLPSPIFDSIQEHNAMKAGIEHIPYPFRSALVHATAFIEQYHGNHATYNAYRRELERLLQWLALIAKKELSALQRQDLENFIHFCQHPPQTWIASKKADRFINKNGERVPNPNWRPFVATVPKQVAGCVGKPDVGAYKLSTKALAAVFAILNSFFNYLVQINYLGINPISQMRQKSKYFQRYQSARVIRRLSELQWTYVIETAELSANENPLYERTLFILSCLYGMYLRISELSIRENWQPRMGDFHRDHDGLWWFKTLGKGNKIRDISVSNAMLSALKRYRRHLGLPALPTIAEATPLLLRADGKLPLQSTRQLRDIVQFAFDKAVARLQADGFADDASQLQAATVHWLRHTGISDDVKIRPREHVRDDAGHSSSAITDLYVDIEKRERHASAKSKLINPD